MCVVYIKFLSIVVNRSIRIEKKPKKFAIENGMKIYSYTITINTYRV